MKNTTLRLLAFLSIFFLSGCVVIDNFIGYKQYPTNVTFDESKCELTLSGAVDNKLVSLYQSILQKNKEKIDGCKKITVFLSSTGGNVYPAFNIGNSIRANGFNTSIVENEVCVSACNIIFISGQKRLMSNKTKFGVHQMMSTGGNSDKCVSINDGSSVSIDYLKFIKKMLPNEAADFYVKSISNVNCRSVKFLFADELKLNGIVTDIY
jgi:ATP-dependent protease ClpP protease subunit